MLPHLSDMGPSRLSRWMEKIAPCGEELAWCHTTDGYKLQKIIASGQLFASDPCRVFGERLSYFFYGRPAYRVTCDKSMRTSARAPVVIMMSPEVSASRQRVFPFDTGAFVDGRYGAWLHKSMQLRDFELTHLVDAPRRYVPSFYGSNGDYLRLKPRTPPVPYAGDFEVEALVAMLSDPDASGSDDRRLTMELQVARPIPFEWPLVRGLILPRDLEDAEDIASFLAGPGAGIEVRWYDLSPLKVAIEYQALLEYFALELHSSWRLL
jgi:hypothetical protein